MAENVTRTKQDWVDAGNRARDNFAKMFANMSKDEQNGVLATAKFFTETYMDAGHKNLSRMLLDLHKQHQI